MTVKEAAGALQISERAVLKRINSGHLRARRIGERLFVIEREEIERAAAEGRLKPGPKPGISRQAE